MTLRLRIAHVGPVATTIPAPKNGSVELVTALLTDGLVELGHDVTLFCTGSTRTKAKLHARFPVGYAEDPHGLWPWEMVELMNLAAACERSRDFDLIHYQGMYYPMSLAFSRVVPIPIVQTLHHQPHASQVAMWRNYREAHFVAISQYQAAALQGFESVTTIMHGLDLANFEFGADPGDYLVFLGRLTAGKGVLEAIEVAREVHSRLLIAAPDNDYYHREIARHVDGEWVQYLGELDFEAKTRLLAGARALLYPVQEGEPFGLVLVEAMACGTPVLALRKGAVGEIVRDGVSGYAFDTLAELIAGVPQAYALDRAAIRAHAQQHFDAVRMVREYEALYTRLVAHGS